MRTIIICRHSKAKAAGPGQRDHTRDLSKRGRADAQAVGKEMRRRGLAPGVVMASDSVRTRRTTELILAQLDTTPEVLFLPELYATTASGILDTIATYGMDAPTVLVVAHNPAAEEVASRAAGFAVHLGTSGVAVLAADGTSEFAPLAALTLKDVFGPPEA